MCVLHPPPTIPRAVRKESKLGASMADLGTAGQGLAQFEREPLRTAVAAVAQKAGQAAALFDSHATTLGDQ